MAKLSRKGDKNTTGGKILKGSETVFAEGKPVGLHVSEISPHNPKPNKKPPIVATTLIKTTKPILLLLLSDILTPFILVTVFVDEN